MKNLTKTLVVLWLTLISTAAGAKELHIASMKVLMDFNGDCQAVALDDPNWQAISIFDLKQSQRACLYQSIDINPTELPQYPAIIIEMLSARKIYWDGELLGINGQVGNNKSSERPGAIRSYHLIPPHLLKAGNHVLRIEASMFHISEPVSRLFYSVTIGDYTNALTQPLLSSAPAILLIGALVLICLFFQAIFWLYQRRISYQIFSLLCLSSACLMFTEKYRAIFGYSYDWHLVRLHWLMLFTFISMCLLPCFYLFYFRLKHIRYWVIAIVLCLVFALLFDPRYDAKSILMFAVSALLSLAINLLALRHKNTSAIVGSILFITVLLAFVSMPLYMIYRFTEQWFVVIYFIIILSIMTTLIREMNRNRARALTSARLEADLLRRNLQPHFLMNSLMLIIEWIEHKPQAAVQFVQSLSDELRMLIQYSSEKMITLDDEIALCRRHLEIMSHRYMADYQLVTEGQSTDIEIPPAVIHTQIENAFTHNRIARGAVFTLTISHDKNDVVLQLRSPYKQKSKKLSATNSATNSAASTGTGEKYIQARLKERFDDNYEYQSYPDDEHWINLIRYKTGEH